MRTTAPLWISALGRCSIRISAIICTLDRAHTLAAALASLTRQTLDANAFEVLVVDNGSVDETPAVVAAARAQHRALVAISEPTRGLSHARNAGLARAQAPLVAYLDDDAEADPTWLAAIVDAFASVEPRPVCVGGPVAPLWDAPRPPWLADAMLPYLTAIDWGLPAGALPDDRFIAGANMAFDREALRAVGGFPTHLGRVGASLLSNEELVVQRALRQRGGQCRWDPAVRVGHHMAADRLTRRWFLRRYYWQGVSDAVMDGTTSLGPAAAHSRAAALRRMVRWGAHAVGGPAPHRFAAACEILREATYLRHRRRSL